MKAPDPTPEQTDEVPLEKRLERLEEIVQKLESDEVGLEQSIDLYAEGHRIGREALRRLEALERRIQKVTGEDDEGLELEDFPDDEGEL